jgi:hypothetical protein
LDLRRGVLLWRAHHQQHQTSHEEPYNLAHERFKIFFGSKRVFPKAFQFPSVVPLFFELNGSQFFRDLRNKKNEFFKMWFFFAKYAGAVKAYFSSKIPANM